MIEKNNEKGDIEKYIGKTVTSPLLNQEAVTALQNIIEQELNFPIESTLSVARYYPGFFFSSGTKGGPVTFYSDNPFESLLAYHLNKENLSNLTVVNKNFSSLGSGQFYEKYDFVYSPAGLTYTDLFSYMKELLLSLKIDGTLALIIPGYWFNRDNLTDTESAILEYSKRTDKKWMFPESIDAFAIANKAQLRKIIKTEVTIKINRLQLAWLSSIEPLYNGEMSSNRAVTELCPLPVDNITLPLSILIITKEGKTYTADNLFK